jgi:hypothetical protein
MSNEAFKNRRLDDLAATGLIDMDDYGKAGRTSARIEQA